MIQVSPERLVQAGVSVSRVVQSAGEFIVIFPQSFTANIGCGFGVSESLHLAPASWFPLGCSAAQVSMCFIFTARRYAKCGICCRRVPVCVSVCHTPVLYQNG